MDRAHFVYPFVRGWTFGLPLPLGDCESCCCDHACASIYLSPLNSHGYTPGSGIAGSRSSSTGNFLKLINYFWLHWVFVAARGLFSSCGERGLLFVAVRGLLIAVASPVVERGLQARGLSSCGSRA